MINKKKFEWGNVMIMSLSHFIYDSYSSFFQPLSSLIKIKFSLSHASIGFLSIIQQIPSLFNPFIGILVDKKPVRYFIIVTPAITTVAMSLVGVASHYTVLCVLLFISGVCSSLYHVPAPVIVKNVSGNQTGKGMSIYMLGGETARTIAPLIITGVVSIWGMEGTWRLIPFGIAASVLLFFKIKNFTLSEEQKNGFNHQSIRKTVIRYLPFFSVLSGVLLFRSVIRNTLITFLVIYLNIAKGESLWFSNTVFSAFQLGGMAGVLSFGIISDRIGRKTSLLIICLIAPVLLWFLTVSQGAVIIPLLFIMGFFAIGEAPVILALVNEQESGHPAFLNSIYMTISFGLSAVVAYLGGVVSDYTGVEQMFRFAAYVSTLGIPLIFLLPGRKKKI